MKLVSAVGIYLIIFYIVALVCGKKWHRSIYQRVQDEQNFSEFSSLVVANKDARLWLQYNQLTVFVPKNESFLTFEGDVRPEMIPYHMSFEAKELPLLRTVNWLGTANLKFPPLWLTTIDDDIYVNNAKVLLEESNYVSRSSGSGIGKKQILHVIDAVLDPVISSSQYPPNAYDFLSSTQNWTLGIGRTVQKFFQKVQWHQMSHVYKRSGEHTFLIPLDSGIDSHKFNMIDNFIISGHIIPNYVLFTRPVEKNFFFQTLTDQHDEYMDIKFEEDGSKVFVVATAKGNFDRSIREAVFSAEVIKKNIPVNNGVIHLISQPLGVFDRILKPFPYLPVLHKISSDPNLDAFYKMGRNTGLPKVLEREDVNFTYFVASNNPWKKLWKEENLELIESDKEVLGRHLVISRSPYSMELLVSMSHANNYRDIYLNTLSGELRLTALKIGDEFFIKWHNRFIKVLRANYECANGLVHILSGPMAHFKKRRKQGHKYGPEAALKGYAKGMNNVWKKIVN